MWQMFILRRIIHGLPRVHKLLTNIEYRVFQLNEPNSQTSAVPLPIPPPPRTSLTHVARKATAE